MPLSTFHGVSHTCFGLSYLLAFGVELLRLWKPTVGLRTVGLVLGGVGLVTHTLYLGFHPPAPAAPYGSLVLVAWVLAVFYFYGTVHHARRLWAVFVLPVVVGLVGLSLALIVPTANQPVNLPAWLVGERAWGAVHGLLILGAAVGVSIAFLASVMYLVQAKRVRAKMPLSPGSRLLSLERLESMNRNAVNVAFPLLTAGLILGGFLTGREHDTAGWWSVKVLGTAGLWTVCGLLLYMRYATAVPPRRSAILAVLAFGLMLAVLAAAHPFAGTPPTDVRPEAK